MTFDEDYDFMMHDEDAAQAHKTVADAPDIYENGVRIGAFAISGVNSAAFPADFALINAVPQNQRGPYVRAFYKKEFFNIYEDALNDAVEARVFNMAVNGGMRLAVKLLQMAVNSLGGTLTVDGVWGPVTVAAANVLDQAALLNAYRQACLQKYKDIVARDPSKAKYLGTAEHPGPWWLRATR